MILTEKETAVIQELQTQEQSCIEKYGKYASQAQDTELRNLFHTLQKSEQKHYDSLRQVLSGSVPSCNCNDSSGKNYNPSATYSAGETEAKRSDCFLATDSDVRKLLADIQVEEQNHAEMLYKYKTVNGMA